MNELKPLTYEEKFNVVGGAGISGALFGGIAALAKELYGGVVNLIGSISVTILAHKTPKNQNFNVTIGNTKFENKPQSQSPAKQPPKVVDAPHQWVSGDIL